MTRAAILIAALALGGCATSQVALAPGENGSFATLDPKSGDEIASFEKPGSLVRLAGRQLKTETLNEAEFEKRYGRLLALLPAEPRLFTLYFAEGSTQLTPESLAILPQIFEEIKSRPGADIQITGHTDTVGREEVNDAVSLKRAAEVTSFLFTQGLDQAIVRIAGRGERELKVRTPDETPNASNRRVEVVVR